ncbi:MAG: helix-turn-helix domain-containing protein [Atopobiaceae bacterium]|nr:helix-turn-helix domain-containing protein [Atopobiaceae bacterium]
MRVRTIIDMLGCSSHAVTDEGLLDRDVVVWTASMSSLGSAPTEESSILTLARFGEGAAQRERSYDEGVLLVHVPLSGDESLDDLCVPPHGVVYVASERPYHEFLDAFRRLPEQCALLSLRRVRLHDAFLHCYDLQQFADKAAPIIGNPLLITNSDHRLLANAGSIPEDRADVEEVIECGYLSDGVNASLESDGVIHDVRVSRHAVLTVSPRFGERWAHSIVYVHHMEMGRLDVLENEKPITPTDLELIDYAGTLVGVMIERLGVAGERVGAGSSVLRDLINGTFVNEETMRSQVVLTQLPLGESYVMLAVVGQRGAGSDYYTRAGRLVSDAIRKCLWTVEGNVLAVIVPVGRSTTVGYDDYGRTRKLLMLNRRFRTVLDHNDMYAYVSEPFTALSMSAGRFIQCIELLDAVGENHEGRIRLFWEDRFAVMACNATSFEKMDALIDKRVIAMKIYDQEHGTQYLETAIMSVNHPGSPAEAADALNVHRNTYFYRVNKVRELFFIDLKDGDDRLSLAFTARVLEGLGDRFFIDPNDYAVE